MTLDQLRIFAAVAEREHVTRAAETLGLTQSAVSAAIHALEARHDIVLFNRVGRRIELTQEGRMFLEHARTILRTAADAEQSLLELRGLKRGVIDMHASQTVGAYWLPDRLARFHAAHPNINVRLSLGNTDQVAEAVIAGRAEIGFVEGVIDQPDLITEQIDLDRLVVVAGRSHPLARLRQLGLKQLTQAQWILRERGSGTRSVFEHALMQLGLSPQALNVVIELPSNEAIRAVVEAGMGLTAISRFVVESALRSKSLISLKFAPIERPFTLITHPERKATYAANAFIEMLRLRAA